MSAKKKLVLTVAASMIFAATSSATIAQMSKAPAEAQLFNAKLIEDMGGASRINFSGKLRMLSQRIPASACNLNAGVDSDLSKEILVAATAEFDKILNALENGDPSLGIIGKETRRKTLAALDDLKTQWAPVGAATNLMLKDGTSVSLTQKLADQNGPLLDAAKKLVSELSGQYSDPAALVQSDALRIDIAGRQRMLSQRISKDICMALSGINVEASLDSLGKAISTFDVSLTALRMGMPAAGIKASTDPEIVAGLDVVAGEWAALQPYFQTVTTSGTFDNEARANVFQQLNALLVDMNKVVGRFSEISKQQI